MTVSFLIPAYNCADFVVDCVRNLLLSQGFDYEILIVDDGSKDQTGAFCDRLCAENHRVRCIHQQNQGASSARNRAMEEAQGDYVMFVDADDQVDAEKLSFLVHSLQGIVSADMILFGLSFDYYRNGQNYRSERFVCPGSGSSECLTDHRRIQTLFKCNYLSPVYNKLIRRQLLLDHKLQFNPELFIYEDLDFSIRALAHCGNILCSDQVIYRYRQTEDEGNAGRRVKRIARISTYLRPLQASFSLLAEAQGLSPDAYTSMLTNLFLILAQQKIQVSDRADIRAVCRDFRDWTEENNIAPELLTDRQFQDLLNERLSSLLLRRDYTKLRHRAANTLKYLKYRVNGNTDYAQTS